MVDFYFKFEEDSSYNPTIIEETSEVQIILNQIKMLIFTQTGDVLGVPNLGLNIQSLIYDTNYNKNVLLKSIKTQFDKFLKYNRESYRVDFDINFYNGTSRDIGVLTVVINNQNALDIVVT